MIFLSFIFLFDTSFLKFFKNQDIFINNKLYIFLKNRNNMNLSTINL